MIKRLFLFIVEGPSDKEALNPIISELFDTAKIRFEILRSDLTTNNDTRLRNSNIKQRVTKVIKNYLENNRGMKKAYIEKVIFLTDTDGCYIDNDYIYYSQDEKNFRYEDDGIYTNRVQDAVLRNELKSKNLNIISSTNVIFSLPFESYYFSCNLDHVLHNERNLGKDLKENYAIEFADRYEDKEEEFIDYVNNHDICLTNNYRDSWIFIKQDKNSLLRYTNLNTFFINNIEYMKEEVKHKISSYNNDKI